MKSRQYDIVVYGGTGVTGFGCVEYLAKHSPAHIEIAVAGRRPHILEKMVEKWDRPVDVLFADSSSPQSLHTLASKTRVLASTVGPYDLYGEPVIDACVHQGTDYVDITGETPFIQRMIAKYHDLAAARGVRIIPFCGFDSVPSDMGAFYLCSLMQEKYQEPVRMVKTFFKVHGGLNGGTVASALNMAATGDNRKMLDPLLLNLPEHQSQEERRRSYEPMHPLFDSDLKRWSVPFIMAAVNSAVVRRSHSLLRQQGKGYGPDFEYHERLLSSKQWPIVSAYLTSLGIGALIFAMQSPLGRKVIQKIAPTPGAGPTEKAKDQGFFQCTLVGETASGHKEAITCFHQGDPGNRATTKFLAEAALTLVEEREHLPGGSSFGGVLTPATGLAVPFQQRLALKGMRWKGLAMEEIADLSVEMSRSAGKTLTDRPV